MIFVNSFLFCGFVCLIGQMILDNTKLTPGHVTTIFVVVGAFLDTFSIYDKIVEVVGGGAMDMAMDQGIMGLVMGMFNLTASGITSAIVFSFFLSLIFKPKD